MKINNIRKGYLINALRWHIYYNKCTRLILNNIAKAKRMDLLDVFITEMNNADKELVSCAKKIKKRHERNKSR